LFKRRTPYFHKHAALNAEFADRIGYAAAVNFGSVAAEHNAARAAVGLFDVYSQYLLEVSGADAVPFLQGLIVNDLARIPAGAAVYTSVCDEGGGMIDDLLIYRLSENRFRIAPTPSRFLVVHDWLVSHAGDHRVTIVNYGPRFAYISVQGPNSRALLSKLTSADLSPTGLKYFRFVFDDVASVPAVMISRTGYSGELGYELFYSAEYAEYMWDQLIEAGTGLGAAPCGLQSLATLRMEKKFPLYGLDLSTANSPVEAGLEWTIRPDKGEFVGRDMIVRQLEEGPPRRLMLIAVDDLDAAIAIGDPITVNGRTVGDVTSVAKGWTVGKALAQGYIATAFAEDLQPVTLEGKSGRLQGTLHRNAIYDPDRTRARS
jgi:aminomethyltransferase